MAFELGIVVGRVSLVCQRGSDKDFCSKMAVSVGFENTALRHLIHYLVRLQDIARACLHRVCKVMVAVHSGHFKTPV